ncbi:ARM repeat-containing protein [Periconia macrospinosa]|uniref:ARM repeat-containing protein n=1 Tax=Periconia macrospinosa TaxID=97972 RepID=A0A2V1DN51_9PLEO|nr:ARM repeat-containing protein [Periconia macrospinosa]
MGRSSIPHALAELSNPSTPEAQVNALRNLKNEIVGHEQRKELAVVHGIVKPLAGLLKGGIRKGGKRRSNGGVTNGGGAAAAGRDSEWDVEDELRFQATLVVGSLANGGPAFITPLLIGDALSPLLEALSPTEIPPKLVLTTLRTLNQIVDAVAQEKSWWDSSTTLSHKVTQQLYTKAVIGSLSEIFEQSSRSRTVYQQISSAAQLIVKTCREKSQRKLLLEAGVLELLSEIMADIAAADDPSRLQDPNHHALPRMYLSDILEAISAIIKDSHYNSARFLYSPPIQNVFTWPKAAASNTQDGHSGSQSHWDGLIPRLQTLQNKHDSYTKSWPALGTFASTVGDSYSRLPGMESIQQAPSRNMVMNESETPLFTWLMFVARRGEGRERLSACWLLSLLKKFGDKWALNDPSRTTRERHFSYLIVPLVVRMIEEVNPTTEHAKKLAATGPLEREEVRLILERAPLVLAELCVGNKTLQNAAIDAHVLPELIQILKKSFDPVTASSKPLWQPKSSTPAVRDPLIDPASSTLGDPGLCADVLHAFRYRESALLALAAIADTQDGLRRMVIDLGAATHIIDSLVPYQATSNGSSIAQRGSTIAKDGNPEPVLIAACILTRSLSRSISMLRTSLIDHGVARPVFDLLKHSNIKVQIAATDVIINLVLDFSPMRTGIIEAGALKTLCDHCHSANFDLRLGSLWALKHLCLNLQHKTRLECLDELGVGWLVQVLKGEPSRTTASAPLGMGTSNAAGEQVDILNAADDPHMDVDDDSSSSEDEDTMIENLSSLRRHPRPEPRYANASNIRDRLQQIRDDEQDARINSERDDIRIQEQALDFLRNFLTEEKASGEMVDHLLTSFGHSAFFELLDSKLRPKNILSSPSTATPNPTSTTTSSTSGSTYWSPTRHPLNTTTSTPSSAFPQPTNFAGYSPPALLSSTLFILVHVANGRPAQRSLLLSQTPLMTHILPLLSHPHREVRSCCAWLIQNLIWIDDHTDEPGTRERASILRTLGFEEGAKLLSKDADLDVRERGKTAVEQMSKLLGSSSVAAGGVPGFASPAGSGSGGVFGGGGGGAGDSSGLGGMRKTLE